MFNRYSRSVCIQNSNACPAPEKCCKLIGTTNIIRGQNEMTISATMDLIDFDVFMKCFIQLINDGAILTISATTLLKTIEVLSFEYARTAVNGEITIVIPNDATITAGSYTDVLFCATSV